MKGEVYSATAAARRRMGQKVHVLDLRDGRESDSLNPLDLIRRTGTDTGAIARSFAAELVERTGHERESFWLDWSESVITGGVAWLLADAPDKRLSALFDLLTGSDPPFAMAVMLDNGTVKDRSAKAAFCAFLNLPEKETRPSVLGSALAHLRFFDSELCRKLTDTTTLDLDALIAGEPMSLYIIVPPHRLTAYRPLLRLWLSGLILALTQRQTPPQERTLILCDELGNLGKIDVLVTAATLMRSWGLTLWLFLQNIAQLAIYAEQANTLIDNAGIIQIFGARNRRMAQDLATIVGSVSAEDILSLPKDEQFLLIDGTLTRAHQVRHYNDQLFKR
jgi:type IV secretion system protein VirD4